MKKIPIEDRKISTTFALYPKTLEKLDEIQRLYPEKSRSYALEEIIGAIYNAWIADQKSIEEIPDDVSEIGYNPYTGSYEEDL